MGLFKSLKSKIAGNSNKKNDKYSLSLDDINVGGRFAKLASRYRKINEEYFNEVEELLISADIGVDLVDEIITEVQKEARIQGIDAPSQINELIVDKIYIAYAKDDYIESKLKYDPDHVNCYLIVGVNGVGKTTTIAKLAHLFLQEGKSVMLVAGDTFRAGAVEQLQIWGERLKVEVISKGQNADPSAVMFEAAKRAKEEKINVLLIDTAGRLQNKTNLMAELAKIKKVLSQHIPHAPSETLLIIDGTTGQNGLLQAQVFKDIGAVTGLILTKMDGTSKGGIVLSIKDKWNLPVRYVGIGEKLEDLIEFDLENYLYSLLKEE
jgi:fused signal recognition particle receptor